MSMVQAASGQGHGSTRTGRARTGPLSAVKEWPKQGKKNRGKAKPSRTGSRQQEAGQW